MEGSDNIMSILKSITPIRYKYSKENKLLDKTFKSMSLQNLMRTLDSHLKPKDDFAPSPEYLKNKNKYEINFKNSNDYIRELSNLNNLPLIFGNKDIIKDGKFNDEYDISNLGNKEAQKKMQDEKERRKKERYEERLKKLKLWKESHSNIDNLKYHPNYDYIRKKVFCVHIRPPTVKKIRLDKKEIDDREIKEKKKKKNNSVNTSNIESNIERKQSRISIPNLKHNPSEVTFDKNKHETNTNSVTITLNNIPLINIKESGLNSNNKNSFDFIDSNSNRSNSSKLRELHSNNYLLNNSATKNILMNKAKALNLKNKIKLADKNSSNNSDYYNNEMNKSTNIEELSLLHQERDKFYKIQSNRSLNKNMSLPKIRKKLNSPLKSKTNRYNGAKHCIYFKKMLGREHSLFNSKNNQIVLYAPNYENVMPHIPSTIFKYRMNDADYKKYITNKIIRGYNYSSEKYFVFDFKKNKSKRMNSKRERLKMLKKIVD